MAIKHLGTTRLATEFRVLIVGGYGTFGGRLVELLEDDARLTLLVAGRSFSCAQAYCAQRFAARAELVPMQFDHAGGDARALAGLNLTLVVERRLSDSVEYGRQPRAAGFVVESVRHQRQRLGDP